FEREGRLPAQVVERRLQEHQDLGGGIEWERLQRGGELAELLRRPAARPAATVASVVSYGATGAMGTASSASGPLHQSRRLVARCDQKLPRGASKCLLVVGQILGILRR